MVQLAYDFTGDGWPDVLNMSGNAGNGTGTLFVNPKGENRRWDSFVVMQPPDGVVGNEETLLKDIDGDGKPEIIHTGQNTLRYSKPDPANPTGPWIVDDDLRARPVGREHQPRHGRRRHQRRRADGLRQRLRLVAAAAEGQHGRSSGRTIRWSSPAGARRRAARAARRWASTTSTATS